jgi:DNA (cytosine-5)-methyltransferase 1
VKDIAIADLFCGAGGTSSGAVEAIRALGFTPKLTAINHWDIAIATHTANHPDARHLCTSLDNINPRHLFREGELEVLWASPECTHHSVARGGKPINDQSRATAWCVVRWAEALRPGVVLVENVPEFETWGAIGANGRPLKTKRGATFLAWVSSLESLGYTVDWRVLCAADYGDPTTRRRLFVQAVRGRRKIVWPEPTHAPAANTDMFGSRKAWVAAREIIDWSVQGQSIYERKRPLSDKTMRRIMAGLEKFGLRPFIVPKQGLHPHASPIRSVEKPLNTVIGDGRVHLAEPYLVAQFGEREGQAPRVHSIDEPCPTVTAQKGAPALAQPFLVRVSGSEDRRARSVDEPMHTITARGISHGLAQPFLIEVCHGGERPAKSIDAPVPTVTCANRGELALCQPALLPQHAGGVLRPVTQPTPTVTTDGAIGLVEPFLVSYYGTGGARSTKDPLDTVTTKDRHALVRPVVIVNGERYQLDIRFRMLQPHELAAAQGFRRGYKFTGTKSDQVKQIGNAVPRRLARALCLAALSQQSNVADLMREEEAA